MRNVKGHVAYPMGYAPSYDRSVCGARSIPLAPSSSLVETELIIERILGAAPRPERSVHTGKDND